MYNVKTSYPKYIGSFVLSSENFGTMRDTLIIKEP